MGDTSIVLSTVTAAFVVGDAICVASGAVNGAVGAAILKRAGHDGYDVLSATRNGAVGGAVIGLVLPSVINCLTKPFSTVDADGRRHTPFAVQAAGYAASAAAFTATGSAILHSAGHQNVLDASRSAAAGAVGSATFGAAAVALSVCLWGGVACLLRNRSSDDLYAMNSPA